MTLNRIYFICLAAIAGSWGLVYIAELRQRADDDAFYARNVAPHFKSGKALGSQGPMEEWLARTRRRSDHTMLRMNLLFAAMGLTTVWTIAMLIRSEAFWRKRNSPTRSADPNAGRAIREVQGREGLLIAQTSKTGLHFLPFPERAVEVNFAQRTATFRGFRFITSFVGNKPLRELTLPFAEILGGRIWVHHGRSSLHLRTTAGKVTIPETVQPFQPLAAVLLDAAEMNRKDPTAFAATLAREPQIKLPWYGWLILALALALIAGLAALLWNLPVKSRIS